MTWGKLAAATCAAGLVAAAPAPPADHTLDESGIEILALDRERYQRMTVPVTIGDHGPFNFMLDTGAQATVVSRALADQLELFERQKATLVGMASRRSVETISINDFGLGNRRFVVMQAPLVEGAYIGGADGILGLDSLQNQRVLLDFRNQQIAVADAEELGGNRGYDIVVRARSELGQLIITEARLDRIRISVIVDTGAQASVGNIALLERLRRSRPMGDSTLTDINGQTMGGPVRLAGELMVGRASVKNFPVLFTDSPSFHALGLTEEPALILGMSELRLFRRVAIDFKARRVLFDLPPSDAEISGRHFRSLTF